MFPLVPKLRLGMPLRAKLCFNGSTLVADGRAHRGNGIARTHALPNGVWGAKGKPALSLSRFRGQCLGMQGTGGLVVDGLEVHR